jgi:hypothetical protein
MSKEFKLVPVEPTEEMIHAIALGVHRDIPTAEIWPEVLACAPEIDWPKRALEIGLLYVRESDDHYVTATPDKMADLLREVVGIDIRRPNGCGYHETAPQPPSFIACQVDESCGAAPQPPSHYQCGACANGCMSGCQVEKDSPPALGGEPESTAWVITDEDGTIDATVRRDVAKHSPGPVTPMISLDSHRASLAPYQAENERLKAELTDTKYLLGCRITERDTERLATLGAEARVAELEGLLEAHHRIGWSTPESRAALNNPFEAQS